MKEIRLLRADEIDCRIGQTFKTQKAVACLLYKDARVDMTILDETFGIGNWQRTHEVIADQLYCNIDIWDSEKKCWVRKQDVGTESMTEKEKGRASDSFKRAGFNVGIGRELYTAPFIWINLDDKEFNNGKPRVQFEVKEIGYDSNRRINRLIIVDKNGKERYTMGSVQQPKQVEQKEKVEFTPTNEDHEKLGNVKTKADFMEFAKGYTKYLKVQSYRDWIEPKWNEVKNK